MASNPDAGYSEVFRLAKRLDAEVDFTDEDGMFEECRVLEVYDKGRRAMIRHKRSGYEKSVVFADLSWVKLCYQWTP